MTEKWRAEKYLSFLLHDDEHFLTKTSLHISAIHFSVIAFEWFCRQLFCPSEKLVALVILTADKTASVGCLRYPSITEWLQTFF